MSSILGLKQIFIAGLGKSNNAEDKPPPEKQLNKALFIEKPANFKTKHFMYYA